MISVATLPRYKEFERIVKITGAGVILIGAVGVMIMAVLRLILE
jgi:preprotein translocase subunit Sss1